MTARATAYVGLGSNLADPAAQVARALDALAALPGCVLERRSRLYGNPPMGPPDQPDYVNAVCRLSTVLAPRNLLEALHGVERSRGRIRGGRRWGPRVIDLDLLLYDDVVIDEDGLTVPHPGLAERAFVLVPLHEIAPALALPDGTPIAVLLESLGTHQLSPLAAAGA